MAAAVSVTVTQTQKAGTGAELFLAVGQKASLCWQTKISSPLTSCHKDVCILDFLVCRHVFNSVYCWHVLPAKQFFFLSLFQCVKCFIFIPPPHNWSSDAIL